MLNTVIASAARNLGKYWAGCFASLSMMIRVSRVRSFVPLFRSACKIHPRAGQRRAAHTCPEATDP